MNFREFFITNGWWGKILGAFFGYLIAGSVGALFGILIGNFFDKGLSTHFANPHWYYHSEKRKELQKLFFEATFLVMGHIAKADGRVSEQEINMAKSIMKEMGLSKQQQTVAKSLFNEGKQPKFNLDSLVYKLNNAIQGNRELLQLFADIQYRAAQADGLTTKKIQALDAIFSRLGFAPLHQQYRFHEDFEYYSPRHEQYRQQQQQNSDQQSSYQGQAHRSPKNNIDHAYALLEVSPAMSKQEVKRAYRRLISQNHPDKLISKGLPPEMLKLANDKTQKIVKAYELICKSKGW